LFLGYVLKYFGCKYDDAQLCTDAAAHTRGGKVNNLGTNIAMVFMLNTHAGNCRQRSASSWKGASRSTMSVRSWNSSHAGWCLQADQADAAAAQHLLLMS
jgi:hypothetical protein